tara:strand:+ start:266 stop:775 length:510 start_codon:yes stop_codon:yes gene_type:complete
MNKPIDKKNNNVIKRQNIRKSVIKFWNLYWNCLHYISYLYPNDASTECKQSIIKLIDVMSTTGISCPMCRKHFNEWIKNNDVKKYLEKNRLKLYFINLHNNVNKQRKKKILKIEEVDVIYKNFEDDELKSYDLDIKMLFLENKIYEFPNIINSKTRQKLLAENNIIKTT